MSTEISGPVVLSGSGKAADLGPYTIDLSAADNFEIKAALEHFKSFKRNGYEVDATTFPLPTLGPRLEAVAESLHNGSGFSLLRGFDTGEYTDEDNLIVFLGIGSHIGSQRGAQSKSRVMVSHITDAKGWQNVTSEKRHGIHTNLALPFHTDMGCEILALLYRQVAASGGATSIALASAIYSDLLKQPEILKTLEAADWPVQLSVKKQAFEKMPLLACQDGHVIMSVDPGRLGLHFTTGEEPPEGCRLNAGQLEALRVLDELAEKNALAIPAQAGDMLFVNNLGVLHKRDSYVDADAGETQAAGDGGKRRWLMRLWLRNEELGWDIPRAMKLPWEAAYGRGVGRSIQPKYDPSPQPDYKEPRYTSGTAAWLIEDDEA